MSEWWLNNSGLNLLKGVEDSESNPTRLSDEFIVDFLRRIPAARTSFNRLVPNMLPEEQTRLRGLVHSAELQTVDRLTVEDAFQASQNKAGVRTVGRYGGTRRGGNR